ncbi:MAG: GIY-YIG nuclease family protein [Candidatus Acidiferrales bacterium]
MASFWTYILQSQKSGRCYVGHAEDVVYRTAEHNGGKVTSTCNKGRWELVYREEFATRAEAAARERQIKRMKSHRWIERLVRASR